MGVVVSMMVPLAGQQRLADVTGGTGSKPFSGIGRGHEAGGYYQPQYQ